MAADGEIDVELTDGIALATLDRPPANALTAPFLETIDARFAALADDPTVRAVVLTGRGALFSAGMDLKALPPMRDRPAQERIVDALNAAYGRLYGFPKPLVAAINGAAVAGGLFFALVADRRLATEGAGPFALSEVRVGVPFPVAALEIARAELPAADLRRMILGGRTIDGPAARMARIVDEVVPVDHLIERARAAAAELAESPPAAYAAIKAQLRKPVLDQIAATIAAGDDPHRSPWYRADPAETVPRLLKSAS